MLRFVALSLFVLSLAGCGGGGNVFVRGKVLVNGEPLTLGPDDQLVLTFVQEPQGETSFTAHVENDGSFKVPGPTGNGIPPGAYRLVVGQVFLDPQTKEFRDKFNDAYNRKNTTLFHDISSSNRNLTLNLKVPVSNP